MTLDDSPQCFRPRGPPLFPQVVDIVVRLGLGTTRLDEQVSQRYDVNRKSQANDGTHLEAQALLLWSEISETKLKVMMGRAQGIQAFHFHVHGSNTKG